MTDEEISRHMGWPNFPGFMKDELGARVKTLVAKAEAAAYAAGVAAERERCANRLNLTRSEALLQCGEMTAGEWRTVAAVLGWMQARIRAA